MKFYLFIATMAFSLTGFSLALNDSLILNRIKTANDTEIQQAQAAQPRLKTTEVKDFAQTMAQEHADNNAKNAELRSKLGMPADTTIVKARVATKTDTSQGNAPTADRDYLANQISEHRQLLKDLDEKYLPVVKNEEVRSYLFSTKDHVKEHLAKAEEIKVQLGKQ